MSKKNLEVVIRGREGVVFSGFCHALSSVNKTGPFDVLPNHANFVTVIDSQIVLTLPKGRKKRISSKSGILRVKENLAEVFLGI